METEKDIQATPAKELPACPVETTLTLISDKWKVLILRDLMPGTKRFGELKKSI
ncbi:MAG: winged helix-turn-helix transcriptional regulator, partial [Oscillospiraceae bacterium]|nr:winged helix-turn-helix transcriptional regulator [Oscillospiraceae bacterium]